jgi:P27 family predicted phage terminase small subunit
MTLVAVPFPKQEEPVAPREPDWKTIFSDDDDVTMAEELWKRIVTEMQEANTLALVNGFAIKRLVEFHVQYERAAMHIAEHGAAMKAQRRGVFKANLFWTIMRQASEMVTGLEAELGIAPVRRGKALKVNRQKRAVRAADNYLARKS